MGAEWSVGIESSGWQNGSVGRWAGLAVALLVTGVVALALSLVGVVQRADVARLVSRGTTGAAALGRLESCRRRPNR